MKPVRKPVIKRIGIIIITALAIYTAVSFTATKLIYDGIFARFDSRDSVPQALESMVTQRIQKEYICGDNRLTGYLYRSGEGTSLVVLAPGFHASADDYLWQIQSLLEYGWSVFAFDPTGSCDSGGDSAVGFSQALLDLEATLAYIESQDRFGCEDILLFGHSRGGYAACCALRSDYDIAAVVSISGINSPMDGIMAAATEQVGLLAYGNYGFLWLYETMLFGADIVNYTAEQAISESNVPVLVVQGSNDRRAPADRYSIYSKKEAIRSDRTEYLLCSQPEQDGHSNLLFDGSGGANGALMAKIHGFYLKSIS